MLIIILRLKAPYCTTRVVPPLIVYLVNEVMFVFFYFIINGTFFVAPCPILEGLPDNIMLCIMSLLDLQSLVNLSRVCVRFHHLYSDESIWSSVDLTRESIGCKLDPNKLKKIIRFHLSEFVRCVKLSSNANSLSSNKPAVTESVLDLLFERCPNITSIALHKCDMTIVSIAKLKC